MLAIIVAKTLNNVIGVNNELPWHLPKDLQWFKKTTLNSTVIMGKNTFLSIKKPLPERENFVVSSTLKSQPGISIFTSLDEAIKAATTENIFIIGGAGLYQEAIEKINNIYVTQILDKMPGDTFFPHITKAFALKESSSVVLENGLHYKHQLFVRA